MKYSLIHPIIGLSLLFAIQYIRLITLRIKIINNNDNHDLITKEELTNNNIKNLFEAPILFYMVCILMMVCNVSNSGFEILAWTYVFLRYIHSAIHSRANRYWHRGFIFVLSMIILLIMWMYLILRIP